MTLVKGANTVIVPVGSSQTRGVLLALDWIAPQDLEIDACAFVVDSTGTLLDQDNFVFYNNPHSPDRAVQLLQPATPIGPDKAQVLVALPDLAERAAKVLVTISVQVDGQDLAQLSGLRLHALSLQTGQELAEVELEEDPGDVRLLIVAEVYRHASGWKLRSVLQGYADGLSGLVSDLGLDVVG